MLILKIQQTTFQQTTNFPACKGLIFMTSLPMETSYFCGKLSFASINSDESCECSAFIYIRQFCSDVNNGYNCYFTHQEKKVFGQLQLYESVQILYVRPVGQASPQFYQPDHRSYQTMSVGRALVSNPDGKQSKF